ncbi:hypothetical protein ACTL6P_08440 [Endozoicomonas acroporae]|uniref:hypothetical protein n=1 Tax=Endozoicomonas acroporae TaxID=1701104 RepID=UPI0011AF4BAE|nr:hypothetical protein [Endozoicomonas acroporae]
MASTNIWQQFKALIPEGARIVATITANNGNGSGRASGWFGYYRHWVLARRHLFRRDKRYCAEPGAL